MSQDPEIKAQRLAKAQALLMAIESDDEAQANQLLGELAAQARSPVFDEVGRMTREVHDALMAFSSDERLTRLAEAEMPDARDRLRYVITLTDQAATRTLNIVESTLPITDKLSERSQRLKDQLAKVAQDEPDNARLQAVAESVGDYLDSVLHIGNQLRGQLNEVMMAQEFQDLSGQLLLRVIDLLELVEDKLVSLLRLASPTEVGEKKDHKSTADDLSQGMGPQVPGNQADVVQSQDDVDDLLASLGF